MRAPPHANLGGRPPPTMDLNISYILWAITTMGALLAGFSLIANLWIYVFNAIGSVYGWPVMYPDMNHARWLFASFLLSALGAAAFILKLRVEARSRAIITIRLPRGLVARTTGADPVLDKFQCRAQVEIDVYTEALADAIRQHPEGVALALEKGLQIAIADQVTRYSKARIEETLKLSLGECFDLLDIAGVTLMNLRQERVIEETSPDETKDVAAPGTPPDSDAVSDSEPDAEHGSRADAPKSPALTSLPEGPPPAANASALVAEAIGLADDDPAPLPRARSA